MSNNETMLGMKKVSDVLATHCLLNISCAWSMWFDLQKKKKNNPVTKHKPKEKPTKNQEKETDSALKPFGLNSKFCGVHKPFFVFFFYYAVFFCKNRLIFSLFL